MKIISLTVWIIALVSILGFSHQARSEQPNPSWNGFATYYATIAANKMRAKHPGRVIACTDSHGIMGLWFNQITMGLTPVVVMGSGGSVRVLPSTKISANVVFAVPPGSANRYQVAVNELASFMYQYDEAVLQSVGYTAEPPSLYYRYTTCLATAGYTYQNDSDRAIWYRFSNTTDMETFQNY